MTPLCEQAAKALVRLLGCTGSFQPLLLAYTKGTKISQTTYISCDAQYESLMVGCIENKAACSMLQT